METTFIRNYLLSVPAQQDDAATLLALTPENRPGEKVIHSKHIPGIHSSVMRDVATSAVRSAKVSFEIQL